MTLERRVDKLRTLLHARRLPDAGSSLVFVVGDSLCGGRAPTLLERMLSREERGVAVRAVWRPGIGFEGASRLLKEQVARTPPSHVRAVIVLVGTNEAKRSLPGGHGQMLATIEQCLEAIPSAWRQASLVVCTVPLPGRHPSLRHDAASLIAGVVNPAIREAATVHEAFVCELETALEGEGLRTDGVHPSPRGDRVLANRWYDALAHSAARERRTLR